MLHFGFTDLMVFSAVADEHNLTKGAAKIHLAPSSASVRIKNLEDALGLPLLNRQARGVELTKAGEIVDRYAKRAISLMGEMQQSLQPYQSGKAGFIRIAANYGASIDFLPKEIAAFLAKVPEARISLEQRSSSEVVELVALGKADIGISAYPGKYSGLAFLPYRNDRLVIACRKDHPLAKHNSIDFKDCLKYDFLGLTENSAIQRFIIEHAKALGHPLELRLQVDNQQILLSLVKSGTGIAVVSNEAFAQAVPEGELKAVAIEQDWAKRELRIAINEKFESTCTEIVQHLLRQLTSGHS